MERIKLQVRSQLDQVAALVSQSANAVLASTGWPAPKDVYGRPSSSSTVPSAPTPSKELATGQQSSKAQLAAQVKGLEAALAHLPDEPIFEDQRKSLVAKADALKQEISETKPIGRRIDNARAALERAKGRRTEATQWLQLVQGVARAAEEEVDRIAAELDELEAALAKAPGDTVIAPEEPTAVLHQQLRDLLEHIRNDPHVDPALVTMAEAHSSQLLRGFRATISAATQARQNGEIPQPVKQRARVKTTLVRAVNANRAVRTRVWGKRSKRNTTLGEFFTVANSSKSAPLGGASAATDISDL